MELIDSAEILKAPVLGYSKVLTYFDSNLRKFKFIVEDELEIEKFVKYFVESKDLNFLLMYLKGSPTSITDLDDGYLIHEMNNYTHVETCILRNKLSGEIEMSPDQLSKLIDKIEIPKEITYRSLDIGLDFKTSKISRLELLNERLSNEGFKSKIIDYTNDSQVIMIENGDKSIKGNYILIPTFNKIVLYYLGDCNKKILYKNLNTRPSKEYKFKEIKLLLQRLNL